MSSTPDNLGIIPPLPLYGLELGRDGHCQAYVLCIISGRRLKGCDMRCRPEMVVGWYHSHPGFGCWLSGVDINTQQVWLNLRVLITPITMMTAALGMLPEP